ncbi:hypothetical protein J1605_008339 [Eschrichtius robustus]|uniref:O-methyltransferase C-terminal domain-containing protein n=1 Tax=Eschrichtius robustus TaxID=9764 RepID=A0AB34GY23_ESCRO|nr:hypothetical protein J1605_008339 [Eschrichtius robustus]
MNKNRTTLDPKHRSWAPGTGSGTGRAFRTCGPEMPRAVPPSVYESTELASTYLARASPKSQRDMLLYTARTTYLCWGHLAAAVRDGKNQYLKAFGVPSEELFTAIYRSQGERPQAVRGLQDEWRLGGPRVVAALDPSPFPCVCDLGGGSGALAKACMSLYPGSQVTVFDIPDVVQMAKRHFSFPEDERISFCEGWERMDFLVRGHFLRPFQGTHTGI